MQAMGDNLVQVFARELNVPEDQLNDQSSPDNVEQWDSLAAMNLVAAIEETFNVTLSTAEIMKMNTIGIAREVLRGKGVNV